MATQLDSLGENQFLAVRDINHPRQDLLIDANSLAPYKVYTALLSQQTSGSNPIVVSELENTFNGVTFSWTRIATSTFLCTASQNVFTTNKSLGLAYSGGDAEDRYIGITVVTPYLTPNVSSGLPENECRLIVDQGFDYNVQMRVEIRVYN